MAPTLLKPGQCTRGSLQGALGPARLPTAAPRVHSGISSGTLAPGVAPTVVRRLRQTNSRANTAVVRCEQINALSSVSGEEGLRVCSDAGGRVLQKTVAASVPC